MSFDSELTELRSADLRVNEIDFDDKFDPDLRATIQNLLLDSEFS
jgi:hypothetical protein